jgi:glucose/arabinose dehydrogenase
VVPGGFYGWPWYYLGPHQDPRHQGKRPDLKDKVLVPDVLLQAHSAWLALTFYTGTQFPAEYRGHVFAAEHGSGNRANRTGYKVIYAPVVHGKATGEYVDFLTGFAWPDGGVCGRPVGGRRPEGLGQPFRSQTAAKLSCQEAAVWRYYCLSGGLRRVENWVGSVSS